MKNEETNHLNPEQFRRLTGINRTTFDVMVKILTDAHIEKKLKGGRPNKLSVPDMLLMTLEYYREYRTYFHISKNYNLCKCASYNNIKWPEDTLIQDGTFSLPGKKALCNPDSSIAVVLIDASESPIQRPKKNSEITIQGRKSGTL